MVDSRSKSPPPLNFAPDTVRTYRRWAIFGARAIGSIDQSFGGETRYVIYPTWPGNIRAYAASRGRLFSRPCRSVNRRGNALAIAASCPRVPLLSGPPARIKEASNKRPRWDLHPLPPRPSGLSRPPEGICNLHTSLSRTVNRDAERARPGRSTLERNAQPERALCWECVSAVVLHETVCTGYESHFGGFNDGRWDLFHYYICYHISRRQRIPDRGAEGAGFNLNIFSVARDKNV